MFPNMTYFAAWFSALGLFLTVGLCERFLQITDIHLDTCYRINGSSCDYCHRYNDKCEPAGLFGHRACDSPQSLPLKMFWTSSLIFKNVSFILLTGDNSRHDKDEELIKQPRDVIQQNRAVKTALAKFFPNVPVVFTIGNNDVFNHDRLPKGPVADLKHLFLVWRKSIPQRHWKRFLSFGFYRARNLFPSLDIVVLNTMYFFNENTLVSDCNDKESPGAIQMSFLKTSLKSARRHKSRVYIVGHIPPLKHLYLPHCRKKYGKLCRKYASTIAMQFFGHSNFDTFHLMGRSGDDQSVFLTAPSVLPVYNPAIRLYEFDFGGPAAFEIAEYEQYYCSIDRANGKEFVLELEYRATQEYGRGPLNVDYFRRVLKRLKHDPNLRAKYKKFKTVSYSV